MLLCGSYVIGAHVASAWGREVKVVRESRCRYATGVSGVPISGLLFYKFSSVSVHLASVTKRTMLELMLKSNYFSLKNCNPKRKTLSSFIPSTQFRNGGESVGPSRPVAAPAV